MPKGFYKRKPAEIERVKQLGKSNKGKPSPKGMLGKYHSQKTKDRMRETHLGEKAYQWKGEGAGYRAKHKWITRQKGKPKKCFNCGKTKKRMHWANIDHEYRRNENDYVAMCPKCHAEYDKTNKLRKYNG